VVISAGATSTRGGSFGKVRRRKQAPHIADRCVFRQRLVFRSVPFTTRRQKGRTLTSGAHGRIRPSATCLQAHLPRRAAIALSECPIECRNVGEAPSVGQGRYGLVARRGRHEIATDMLEALAGNVAAERYAGRHKELVDISCRDAQMPCGVFR
jgi:hypothetical protein